MSGRGTPDNAANEETEETVQDEEGDPEEEPESESSPVPQHNTGSSERKADGGAAAANNNNNAAAPPPPAEKPRPWVPPCSTQLNPSLAAEAWLQALTRIIAFGGKLTQPLRIGIVGPFGAGKSAVLDTIMTACSMSVRPVSDQLSQPEYDHHTTTEISKPLCVPGTKLELIDFVGFAATTEQGMYQGSAFEDKLSELKIESIILVVDINEKKNVDEVKRARLAKFVQRMKDHRIHNVTVLVTKLDTDNKEFETSPAQMYSDKKVHDWLGQLQQVLKLEPTAMFPCKPYTSERQRSKAVELLVLAGLLHALEQGSRAPMAEATP